MPTARDIMSKNIVTAKKDMSIKDLSRLFLEHKVNGIPVVDDNDKVIGIVTEGDLIDQNKNLHIPTVISLFDAVIYLESGKKFQEEVKRLTGTRVEDIYTPKPVTVSPDTPVADCASLMAEKHIHTLPVVEKGKLIGVIGKFDLIRAMAQE
ncbi:MAG: CBS domain-containing protein [Nitrospinae bacterium]|nr:CBS domain-containing protein [Nitrospinota bacterium]